MYCCLVTNIASISSILLAQDFDLVKIKVDHANWIYINLFIDAANNKK